MIKNETEFKMTVCNQEEENLFLDSLKPNHVVLEWGSGKSTIAIAPLVKQVYSIENNKEWFDELKYIVPENVSLNYVPANEEPTGGDDGTYQQFKDYVDFAATLNRKFDIIFIDGRARVACAELAVKLLKKNGLLFVHDMRNPKIEYRRDEYEPIFDMFELVDYEFTMYKFKPKKS